MRTGDKVEIKEYIVKFVDDTELEHFERVYGTEEELVRCKDCKHFSPERLYMCRIHFSAQRPILVLR